MKAIQMTQRSGIFEHPFGFTPALTLELATGLVELVLRSFPVVEMPRGIKPAQRCFNLFHRLLGLHRFIKKPLGFAPSAGCDQRSMVGSVLFYGFVATSLNLKPLRLPPPSPKDVAMEPRYR